MYYQCAHSVPTRNSCQSDLKWEQFPISPLSYLSHPSWNMLTNQCDWQSNVDCRFNKNPALLSTNENSHQVEPQVTCHKSLTMI